MLCDEHFGRSKYGCERTYALVSETDETPVTHWALTLMELSSSTGFASVMLLDVNIGSIQPA